MTEAPTAERFLKRLKTQRSAEELEKVQRYLKTGPGEYGEGDVFIIFHAAQLPLTLGARLRVLAVFEGDDKEHAVPIRIGAPREE